MLATYLRPMTSNGKRSVWGDSTSWSIGLGVGVAIGVSLGIAMDNIGAGIGIGVAIGVVFALAFSQSKKAQKHDGEPGEDTRP